LSYWRECNELHWISGFPPQGLQLVTGTADFIRHFPGTQGDMQTYSSGQFGSAKVSTLSRNRSNGGSGSHSKTLVNSAGPGLHQQHDHGRHLDRRDPADCPGHRPRPTLRFPGAGHGNKNGFEGSRADWANNSRCSFSLLG